MSQDNVRDAIAIMLTIVFCFLMCKNGVVPQDFLGVFMLVLGFFFGAKKDPNTGGSNTVSTTLTETTPKSEVKP